MDSIKPKVMKSRRAAAVRPDRITANSIAAMRRAYRDIDDLLEADRAATRKVSPRKDWRRYLKSAGPVFGPIAVRQLSASVAMFADLILTAHRGRILATH